MTDSKREHFTIIPNIVFHSDLTPFELGLYCHIVRTAGWGNGACHKSSRTLAAELNCSAGTISKAKRELQRKHWMVGFKPLIEVQHVPRRYGGKPYHLITVVDIWSENTKYFERERLRKNKAAGDSSELAGSSRTVASSHTEFASASDEIKKNCERRSSEESPSSRAQVSEIVEEDISFVWRFVTSLFGRPRKNTIPKREFRLIRDLLPVEPDEIETIRWWYEQKAPIWPGPSTQAFMLTRRPRSVEALLRNWNNVLDVARNFKKTNH